MVTKDDGKPGTKDAIDLLQGGLVVPVNRNQPWAHLARSILGNCFSCVIADELHTIKNNRTNAWTAIYLLHAKVFGLTATAVSNGTLDWLGFIYLFQERSHRKNPAWASIEGSEPQYSTLEFLQRMKRVDPAIVDFDLFKSCHTNGFLSAEYAKLLLRPLYATLVMRRSASVTIDMGDGEKPYVIGRDIPRSESYFGHVHMNAFERPNYANFFYANKDSITGPGSKDGGTSGTERGGVDFSIVRKLLVAACGTMPMDVLEKLGGLDKVQDIAYWQNQEDAGLALMIMAALKDPRIDSECITKDAWTCLDFMIRSNSKLRLLCGWLRYFVVRRDEQTIIATDSPVTTWLCGLFCLLLGISAEWIRSDITMKERNEACDAFKAKGSKIKVLIGAAKLIGTGLNLQSCHNMFVFQPLHSIPAAEQLMGRVDRIGQKIITRIIFAVAANTFEYTRIARSMKRHLPVILGGSGITQDYLDDMTKNAMARTDNPGDPDQIERVRVRVATKLLMSTLGMHVNLLSEEHLDYKQIGLTPEGEEITEYDTINMDLDEDSDLVQTTEGEPSTPKAGKRKGAQQTPRKRAKQLIRARKLQRCCAFTLISRTEYAPAQDCCHYCDKSRFRGLCFPLCTNHRHDILSRASVILKKDIKQLENRDVFLTGIEEDLLMSQLTPVLKGIRDTCGDCVTAKPFAPEFETRTCGFCSAIHSIDIANTLPTGPCDKGEDHACHTCTDLMSTGIDDKVKLDYPLTCHVLCSTHSRLWSDMFGQLDDLIKTFRAKRRKLARDLTASGKLTDKQLRREDYTAIATLWTRIESAVWSCSLCRPCTAAGQGFKLKAMAKAEKAAAKRTTGLFPPSKPEVTTPKPSNAGEKPKANTTGKDETSKKRKRLAGAEGDGSTFKSAERIEAGDSDFEDEVPEPSSPSAEVSAKRQKTSG